MVADDNGGYAFSQWTSMGWVGEQCPAWADSLMRYLPKVEEPILKAPGQEAFSLERPVLTMALRPR